MPIETPRFTLRSLPRLAAIYAAAALAGLLFAWIGFPLPWLVGAIVFAAIATISGVDVRVPLITRPLGQVLIAGSVGLAFTPEAISVILANILPMMALAVLTVGAGFLAAAVLARLAHADVMTASLAMVPIGPVESANLAIRYGLNPGPVVFAQSTRIVLIIVIIPPIIVAITGSSGDLAAALSTTPITLEGTALLFGLALVAGIVLRRLKIANPFFLGPLAASAVAAATGLPVTPFPFEVIAGAQVILGVWLGGMFDRDLMAKAGRYVPATLLATLSLIALCAVMGLGVTAVTGLPWTTMALASAPGSVTEMALTAKMLGDGVALVTAFHLTRIFMVTPAAPLIFRATAWMAGRMGMRN